MFLLNIGRPTDQPSEWPTGSFSIIGQLFHTWNFLRDREGIFGETNFRYFLIFVFFCITVIVFKLFDVKSVISLSNFLLGNFFFGL